MGKRTLVPVLMFELCTACAASNSEAGSGVPGETPNRIEWDGAGASFAPPVAQTSFVCDLIGLGAIGTVPHNFPGASAMELAQYAGRENLVPESSLSAGAHPDVGRVLAADMGWPFVHSDGYVYFTFDDAFFAPASSMSSCPAESQNCVPVALNDDFLARGDPDSWTNDSGCLSLEVERAVDAREFLPITLNGPVSTGGVPIGNGIVPGPGFSTGRFMFLRMPLPAVACSTDAECEASSGLGGDVCRRLAQGEGQYCHFGLCSDHAPCALRGPPSTLAVRSEGSNFVLPRIGEHVASDRVLSAYRGHFATVSFQALIDPATNSGTVWVLGRDSFWSAPGLPMSPYLMVHSVENGVLGEARYFAGLSSSGEPSFASDANVAVPLYEESEALPHHSSLAYFQDLDGGTWLLIYGGHAQPSLRETVSTFVRPVSEDLFYSREAGIYLRLAKQPWGPWSDPATIFNPYTSEAGYCRQMYFDDPSELSGFSCPAELLERNRNLNRLKFAGMAGEYGAAIIPRTLRIGSNGDASFRWLLSTWNPYRVIELETQLEPPLGRTVAK